MAIKHRMVLSPYVYKALQAEALVMDCGLQDAMNKLILDHLSPEANRILNQLEPKAKEPQIHESISPKRKRLADSPSEIAMIKKMWSRTPRPTNAEISRALDRPRQTVDALVKRLLERGEISITEGQETPS